MKLAPLGAQLERFGPDVRIVREPERDELRPGRPQLLGQTTTVRVANVDRGGREPTFGVGLGEESPLRLEVRVQRPVEVQMILREVREHETREARAVEAVQSGRVRGGLERAAAVARVEHLAERRLEVDRLRRRVDGGTALAADSPLDGSHEPRAPARGGEHREEQERRGRLPVRAGHRGDLELGARAAVEGIGRGRHRGPRVGYQELRDAGPAGGELEQALDDEARRAAPDCLRSVIVAVGPFAAHAEVGVPRPDRAAVVGEPRHLRRGAIARAHARDRPAQDL